MLPYPLHSVLLFYILSISYKLPFIHYPFGKKNTASVSCFLIFIACQGAPFFLIYSVMQYIIHFSGTGIFFFCIHLFFFPFMCILLEIHLSLCILFRSSDFEQKCCFLLFRKLNIFCPQRDHFDLCRAFYNNELCQGITLMDSCVI